MEQVAAGRVLRRPTTAQALAARARLILGCAAGQSNTAVARELRLTDQANDRQVADAVSQQTSRRAGG
jgi:hypothetical protein